MNLLYYKNDKWKTTNTSSKNLMEMGISNTVL